VEKEVLVTKNTGEQQPFDESKLISSLKRSGASQDVIKEILDRVHPILYSGIPTKKIYRLAFSHLRKRSTQIASQYKLRDAIMEMGPSGYPFEILVGRLFEKMGFDVEVDVIMEGVCVNHEVDVVARKDNEVYIIECKFHNRNGMKSDVKVPLYIKSRFDDIVDKLNHNHGIKSQYKGWVVTNTQFTEEAIAYAKCSGLVLMAWGYPDQNNLREKIGSSGLYPITVLHKLSKKEKSSLMEKGIIFCEDLVNQRELVESILFYSRNINSIIKEATALCSTNLE